MEFTVKISTIKGNTSNKIRARYFAGVVKPLRTIFKIHGDIKTEKEVHDYLKSVNPDMVEKGKPKSFQDCCDQEIFNHLHFSVQFVAEHFNVNLDI